jgi:hypothetical protein
MSVRGNGLPSRGRALRSGHRVEPALEIREQVVDFLDATRQTNEAVGDPSSGGTEACVIDAG